MRGFITAALAIVLTGMLAGQPTGPEPLAGFTSQGSQSETTWERRYAAVPDPQRLRANMQLLSARPHHVGW